MAGKKKKKNILKSRFYQIYFALVIVALIGIGIGTAWLTGVLKDYESAQPVYEAMEVARLFEDGAYDSLYDVDTSAARISEGDRNVYVQSLTALAQGRTVTWTEAFSPNPDEKRYNVSLDGERFATFTLVPSGRTTPKGNRLWTLGEVTTYVELKTPEPTPEPTPAPTPAPTVSYTCRLTVPQGCAVSVDGVALDETNAQVTRKSYYEEGFLPEGIANPEMTEYVFASSSETPQIAVTDANGAPAKVVASKDKALTWTSPLPEDSALSQQYGKAALALGRQVAKFIFRDANKRSIQKICAKKSPAEKIFDNLSNTYTTPHDGISFTNEEVSEFYALTENCFTCHVSFDVVLNTKKGKAVYPTAYTFCVIRKDDKGMLYNLLIY